MTNAEVRAITRQNRQQVNRLIHELEAEGVRLSGHARGARYVFVGSAARSPDGDMSAGNVLADISGDLCREFKFEVQL